MPYGSRSHETILQYARQDIAFLLSQNVKCIMAACGTVSSTFPASEAEKLPVPYMGCGGVGSPQGGLGHPQPEDRRHRHCRATIRSRSYEQLLRRLVPGVEITARPCPLFVPLCGERLCGTARTPDKQQVTRLVIRQYLEEIRDAGGGHPGDGPAPTIPLLAGMIGELHGPFGHPD